VSLMRSALLWASTNPFMVQRLPRMGFVQRASRRFMPGEEPADALREAERLGARGAPTLVTLLGENLENEAEAGAVVTHYVGLLDEIRKRGLDMELSIKLTQLGLDLSVELARDGLRELLRAAGDSMVWIDMESSAYVDTTLGLFRALREDNENVGVCLQAYLRRTAADVEALVPLKPAIRLVKGAYREPPDVAFPRKATVDATYRQLASQLLRHAAADRVGRVGIATHDARLIRDAQTRAHELALDPSRWEVEMLFGIGRAEQDRLLRSETRLRVLVSYGAHWFPWYMRRLAERPANVWFVVRKMAGR